MRLTVCCCLLLFVVGSRGEEFSLEDAFDNDLTTKPQPGQGGSTPGSAGGIPKQPTAKPQPGGDANFDLGDAVGGDDPYKKPTVKPQPGGGGAGAEGGFGDHDLGDGTNTGDHDGHNNPGGHANNPSGRAMHPSAGEGQGQEGNQGMLAGIVSTVAVAAVGAVSSFIAYQKKKLCFKGATDDPENVNMESHKGDQSEPQVQSTLLAK